MPKLPKCKICKEPFERIRPLQMVCTNYQCAIEYGRKAQEKAVKAKQKAHRADIRVRKEKLKKKKDRIKEADDAFSRYTRAEGYKWFQDRGLEPTCISCGLTVAELKINHYIVMVCGHFLSRGAHTELRYEPDNAHLQCTKCNGGAGKYGKFNNREATITKKYKKNLIKKIGQDRVDWLHGPHPMPNWSHQDLIDIKAKYTKKARELEKSLD